MKMLLNFISWKKRSPKLKPPTVHSDQTDPAPTIHIEQADSTPTVHIDQTDSVPAVITQNNHVSVILHTNKPTICTEMFEKKKKPSKLCKTWRPSLDAISETAALKATQKGGDEKARGKKVKAKGRVMIRTGCDDLRHFGPTMMQSFVPSAFVF